MSEEPMVYSAMTAGVEVSVVVSYLPDQSQPPARYVWAYMVEIENYAREAVQLLSRRWVITDALGHVEVVEGPGVIGEQPVIEPNQSYTYTSGCPLGTDSGSMYGSYTMQWPDGTTFDAEIPHFSLDLPDGRRTVN